MARRRRLQVAGWITLSGPTAGSRSETRLRSCQADERLKARLAISQASRVVVWLSAGQRRRSRRGAVWKCRCRRTGPTTNSTQSKRPSLSASVASSSLEPAALGVSHRVSGTASRVRTLRPVSRTHVGGERPTRFEEMQHERTSVGYARRETGRRCCSRLLLIKNSGRCRRLGCRQVGRSPLRPVWPT